MANEEALIDTPGGVLSYLENPTLRLPGIKVIRNSQGGMQMAVEITGQVGPSTLGDGETGKFRQGRGGEMIVSQLKGRYAEAAGRGSIFTVANQAAVTTTVALATTCTGLVLTNDAGSNVDLVILRAGFGLSVAPAAIPTVGLMGGVGTVTHTTPIAAAAIRSTRIGPAGHAPTTKADGAATIPTPTLLELFSGANTSAALPDSPHPVGVDIDGRYVVPPGAFVAIYTLTVSVGFGFFSWSEEAI
jgi:hypothetical protein